MTDARVHRIYGSSNAHRVLACSGSIAAEFGKPSLDSAASDEGTKAHELVALSLTEGMARIRGADNIEPDMVAGAEMVHDYIESVCLTRPGQIEVLVEQPFEFPQQIVSYDQAGGIADLMLYDTVEHDAWAIEYKYGMLPVEVERNPQLLFNATAMLWNRPVRSVTLVVIQPRVTWHPDGTVREWKCDGVDLAEFQIRMSAAIEASIHYPGDRAPGPHCRYCAAELGCPMRVTTALSVVDVNMTIEDMDRAPPVVDELSPERMAYVLRNADIMRDWLSAVDKAAYARAMSGIPIPGHKLVETRGERKWQSGAGNIAQALADLSGLPAIEFLRTTPVSISDAEAKVAAAVREAAPMGQKDQAVKAAKERMAWLAPRATTGNFTLVPDHDPRPAANRAAAFVGVNLIPQE